MEGIRFFWPHQLAKLDKHSTQTIYESKDEYIPILIEDAWTRTRFKAGKQEKPYRKQFIRLRDIARYVKEHTGKELIFRWEEEKSEWQKPHRPLKKK